MIRTSVAIAIFSVFLTGCEQTKDPELDEMIRLSRALPATDGFLQDYSLVECHAEMKNTCSPKGCEVDDNIGVTQTFDTQRRVYQRGDSHGRDEYPAIVSQSGIWFNVGIPQGSVIFRFNTLGDFLEVVTLGDSSILYTGSCEFK